MKVGNVKNMQAWLDGRPSEFTDTGGLDIELPLKTRLADRALEDEPAKSAPAQPVDEREGWPEFTVHAAPPSTLLSTYLPLIDQLLLADTHNGLTVEVKQDDRVIGTWELEVDPKDSADVYVSQAKATLRVCVSLSGDPRATGAFLVVNYWWVNALHPKQLTQLYVGLVRATLNRLESLMEAVPAYKDRMPPYVLYLIDGRNRKLKAFDKDRLEREFLHALSEDIVPGLDLRVASGRGSGTPPLAPAIRAALPVLDKEVALPRPGRALNVPWDPVKERRAVGGEVFVRERLSEENLRWRRKSDLAGPRAQHSPLLSKRGGEVQ